MRWDRWVAGFLAVGILAVAATIAQAAEPNKPRPPAASAAPERSVGNPLAPGLVDLMTDEVKAAFRTRGVDSTFGQFRGYAGVKLNSTAGVYTGSEITGNCRLSWYDRLLRDPLSAPAQAEKFTRELHLALCDGHRGLDLALRTARNKMDLGTREARPFTPITSPQGALEALKEAVNGAQAGYAAALAPLTRGELSELTQSLYPVLTAGGRQGHTLDDRGTARRLCDLLEKVDRAALYDAAAALAPLADPEFLKQLAALPENGDVPVEGVKGTVVEHLIIPGGAIVIGGKGKNVYDLDKMTGVAAVVDLGGDDEYRNGSVSFQRPVLITVDLAGNDRYEGTKPGIQGGAVLGVAMLIDVAGDDVYRAQDVAQGSCVGGVGILIDLAGDDQYLGLRRVQGHALGGVGILIDREGRDRYHAALWGQGFGGPLGFGALEDTSGNDTYYGGGLYPDSYPETPGYDGWCQGIGAGIRQAANGGIGVILEGAGDDTYEFDYISHGGGYWLGLGFARDFGGNDRRLGGTQKAYGGGPRTEPMFQRFSSGFGCHYALGFCFDDAGDDAYGGTIMSLGFAWDLSVGFLCDFGGNDRYEASGGGTQGNGAQAGLGVLFDYRGDDVYSGYGQAYANPSISYHPMPQCGGNFSFVIDYGGKDTYGCGAQDNSYSQRGAAGGFLIDRPLSEEAAGQQTTDKTGKPSRSGS